MSTDYQSQRAQALLTYEVPKDFALWLPVQQSELLKLAKASEQAIAGQAARAAEANPQLATTLEHKLAGCTYSTMRSRLQPTPAPRSGSRAPRIAG